MPLDTDKHARKKADLPVTEGWKAELTRDGSLVIYRDGLPVGRQSPIQVAYVTTW